MLFVCVVCLCCLFVIEERNANTSLNDFDFFFQQGGRITSMTICESSHAVVSASDNGTIHVFQVQSASEQDKFVSMIVF